ncbi:protein INCREASED PETAL GROWTH ANISOTROPY 1 isoform X2 [Elaeis guineensis]|uniref:Protein CHUP1, chloroplastic n=1 Tax=Elaeis guineensis var. tenera TaxID=51953 RepID=A0A6I9QZL4_ELAGV|nr:protein CHUP1, chloroplastic [Elaeis guineensis]
MVAGKVKAAMGLQKSPATPKSETPRRSSSSPGSQKAPSSNPKGGAAVFSRSFGVYFPRSSAQVQPRPPDVAELLRVVEELQEKESRLRTQLLEQKIVKETVAIVPFLEKEISSKNDELGRLKEKTEHLEEENEALRLEKERLRSKIAGEEEEGRRKEVRIKELEVEIEELRRIVSEQSCGESRCLSGRTGEIDECSSSQRLQGLIDSSSQRLQGLIDASSRSNLLKNLRNGPKPTESASNQEVQKPETTDLKAEEGEAERTQQSRCDREEISKPRLPRVPRPPPLPSSISSSSFCTSSSSESSSSSETATSITRSRAPNLAGLLPILPPAPGAGARPPPPPPPPPLAKGSRSAAASVRRVPEVVEFYHSLMRRDSKRESGSGVPDAPAAANARNMIGEIENRSTHLLAIKTDVETQGDFIRFLINEVENAAFANIEDVVAFVKWLDEELSFLVDERAVLKHFDWPEHKADAMREAAFGYCDLKKLESEASSFRDDPRQPCASALKKMQSLLEKLEQGVYNLSRVRESAAMRYKGFQIPWEWMLEAGFVSQIKLASVKLAMKYMKRVSSELEIIAGGPEEEELMLQGVRFAFRVHQFAGGFDVETMRAFQELKDKSRSLHKQSQNQSQSQGQNH